MQFTLTASSDGRGRAALGEQLCFEQTLEALYVLPSDEASPAASWKTMATHCSVQRGSRQRIAIDQASLWRR
jgi:hypothetical protein